MNIAIGALVGAVVWALTVCFAAWVWRVHLNDPHPDEEEETWETCQSVASFSALLGWVVIGAFVGAAV